MIVKNSIDKNLIVEAGCDINEEIKGKKDLSNAIKIIVNFKQHQSVRFVQFCTRQYPDIFTYQRKGDLQWDKVEDFFMTDSKNPEWKLDIFIKDESKEYNETVYYEELGATWETKDSISVYDQPGPNQKAERFVGCTFIIVDEKVKYLVKWSMQHAEKTLALANFSKEEVENLATIAPDFFKKNEKMLSEKSTYKNSLFDETQVSQLKNELSLYDIFPLNGLSKEEVVVLVELAPRFFKKYGNLDPTKADDHTKLKFNIMKLSGLKEEILSQVYKLKQAREIFIKLLESENKQIPINKIIEDDEFYQVEIENRQYLSQWAWKLLNSDKYISLLKNSEGYDSLKETQPPLEKDFDLKEESRKDFLKPPENWYTYKKFPKLFEENENELISTQRDQILFKK